MIKMDWRIIYVHNFQNSQALADDTRKALEWMLNNLDKEKRVINRPGNKSDRQLLHSGEALIPAGKRARILGSKFAHSNGQRVSVDSETGSKRSDSKVGVTMPYVF